MDQQHNKSRFNLIKRVLLCLVVGVLLIVALLVVLRVGFAADPSAQVKADVAQITARRATPSNAYVYLLGMDAPAGVDPMVRGREQLQKYVASSHATLNDILNDSQDMSSPACSSLTLEKPLQCSLSVKAACAQTFFSSAATRKQMLKAYPDLLARYQQFKTYNDFHQPFAASFFVADLPYSYLRVGQKLLFLQGIDQAEGLYPEHQALVAHSLQQTVLDDLAYWRTALIGADELKLRTLAIQMIHNDLVMLAAIHVRYGISTPTLALLTTPERSLALVNANETVMMQLFYRQDQDYQQCGQHSLSRCASHLMNTLFIDVQSYVNQVTSAKAHDVALSLLPPAQAYAAKDRVTPIPWSFWLRNPLSALTVYAEQPGLKDKIFQSADLNLGITLLNATAKQPIGRSDTAWLVTIQSPYGSAASHAHLNPEGWLCLDQALPQDKASLDGCIPWARDTTGARY